MKKYSMLKTWLNRTSSLKSFIDLENTAPSFELGGFLSIDISYPIHETTNLESESLSTSLEQVHGYVENSLSIIDSDEPVWLDREEVEMIKSELGEPPNLCYPIYIISVGDKKNEKVVYIGKTSSSNSRFKNGHAAITKLHHPKYNGLNKTLYLCGIVLLTDPPQSNYLPLEWVKPLSKAESLLLDIEAQLIFDFQPELNTINKKKCEHDNQTIFHIQNFIEGSDFLNDHFVYPQK